MEETFGERLSRLREEKGLTLEALAEKIGSTKSYVWELEKKPNIRPSASLVYKLSVALNTTVGVLLGETAVQDAAEEDQVFFRKYQPLKPQTKRQLADIMDVLMKNQGGDS